MADLWGDIGVTAGEVYNLCASSEKSMTVGDIKKKLKKRGGLVDFAVGWLVREGKATVTRTTRVGKSAVEVKIKP